MHAATHANQAAIADLLIAYGADLEAKDMEGRTPPNHTEFHNAKVVARLLEEALLGKD